MNIYEKVSKILKTVKYVVTFKGLYIFIVIGEYKLENMNDSNHSLNVFEEQNI